MRAQKDKNDNSTCTKQNETSSFIKSPIFWMMPILSLILFGTLLSIGLPILKEMSARRDFHNAEIEKAIAQFNVSPNDGIVKSTLYRSAQSKGRKVTSIIYLKDGRNFAIYGYFLPEIGAPIKIYIDSEGASIGCFIEDGDIECGYITGENVS